MISINLIRRTGKWDQSTCCHILESVCLCCLQYSDEVHMNSLIKCQIKCLFICLMLLFISLLTHYFGASLFFPFNQLVKCTLD